MGRYTYNASIVTQSIDELNEAINSIKDVTKEIQAGINTINRAKGSEYLDVDYSVLLKLQTISEEVITEDVNTIQEKATLIEEYEQAPWHKKLFSSAAMGLTKFAEGVASGFEDLIDGAASIVGFTVGIFNSDFKDSVAEYVATDHVGDWFDEQYDEGALSDVSKYSWFSEDSTAANIFKGFGTAAPYIALSMTGVGTTVEVVAAGLSGIGSGTEAGINKALTNDPNLSAGDVFNRAFGEGVWQGAKNALFVYGMGKLSQGIQGRTGKVIDGSADDFVKLTGSNADDAAATAKNIFGSTDDLIATPIKDASGNLTGYNFVNANINSSAYGQVVGSAGFNGNNVILNSFDNVVGASGNASAATRIIGDSGKRVIVDTAGGTIDPGGNITKLLGKSFDDIAATTAIGKSGDIFKKAGNIKNNPVGKALNAGDEVLGKVGNAIAKTKPAQFVENTVNKVTGTLGKSKALTKVTTAVGNAVTKHPVASFAAASTVFTLDQVDEDVINSQYRIKQDQINSVTNRPTPTLDQTPAPSSSPTNKPTPTPTIPTTPKPTPTIPTTPKPTTSAPVPTSTSAPVPTYSPGGSSSGGSSSGGSSSGGSSSGGSSSGGSSSGGSSSGGSSSGGSSFSPTPTPTPTIAPTVSQTTSPTPSIRPTQGPTPTTTSVVPNPTSTRIPYNPTPTIGGGGYTDNGYISENNNNNNNVGNIEVPKEDDMTGSITEVVGGNNYVNIPTSATPITNPITPTTKKSIIPAIAGLGAAAVAGIGTKAYLDKKENNDNSEDEEFDAEEWTEEDSLDIDYKETMEEDSDYLNPSDEYAYQEEDIPGSYEAVNSSELASMQ